MKNLKINTILTLLTILFSNTVIAQLQLENAFPNLSFTQPVDIQSPPDGTNRIFVLSQPGIIYSFDNDPNVTETNLFLDIRNQVLSGGEQGLLGLAFHPDYASNGYFFVNYTRESPRRTVISRFKVSDSNPDEADINSELVIMEVNQPFSNHNAGQIAFGPDGYLYISFGDGGSGGDPQGHGQDRQTLLGSIARIDVDNTSGNLNYSIPTDNPFVGNSNGWREEIYAYGLRNVWRFSFDHETNNLWAADVGQGALEEIDLIKNGGNYGWKIMEGSNCFSPSSGCNQNGLELPVWEYGRSEGISITGGYVYRGLNAEEISGKYIYGDWGSGTIWTLDVSGDQVNNEVIFSTNFRITTFGTDQNGEIHLAESNSGNIYKIVGTPVTSIDDKTILAEFKLEQNFPNPFNPTTVISYQLSTMSHAKLIVYDVLGNEVKVLVNETQSPGNYSINFDSNGLSSGVYYYQLLTDSFVETKKMLLLR